LALLGQVTAVDLAAFGMLVQRDAELGSSELVQHRHHHRSHPHKRHHKRKFFTSHSNLGHSLISNPYPVYSIVQQKHRRGGADGSGDPDDPLHDNLSPHDAEVVDAPEDIPRVGNDHEELHNAKLSPDGYHNGFYHKDFEGKYA
jgi:hypothetical protein